MSDRELVNEILSQILVAASRIERRFASVGSSDDFLASEEGIDRLDGICMMLIAIGESLKNLDKVTGYRRYIVSPVPGSRLERRQGHPGYYQSSLF
jgi:uncharacterized protein with HEPN domain